MNSFRTFIIINSKLFRSIFYKIAQGMAFGVGFLAIVGSITYAAIGSQMVKNAGIDFVEYFNSEGGKAGMQAEALHSTRLGTWFPYPISNENYLRGTTYFNGNMLDENNVWYNLDPSGSSNFNNLCINGTCRTSWPATPYYCVCYIPTQDQQFGPPFTMDIYTLRDVSMTWTRWMGLTNTSLACGYVVGIGGGDGSESAWVTGHLQCTN